MSGAISSSALSYARVWRRGERGRSARGMAVCGLCPPMRVTVHVSLVGVANCVGGPGVHSIGIYLAYKTLGDVPDATGRPQNLHSPVLGKKAQCVLK